MRVELAEAVRAFFAPGLYKSRDPSEEEIDRLISIASLTVRARSAVERDGRSGEIELVPGEESPARLVKVLSRLLTALDSIGVDRTQAWRVVNKAALDSIPALRLATLDVLHRQGEVSTTSMAKAVRYPYRTTLRTLEELDAYHLVERCRGAGRKSDTWSLGDQVSESYTLARCVPEMSDTYISRKHTTDKSGTQTLAARNGVAGAQTATSFPGCPACTELREHGVPKGCHQHRSVPNEMGFLAACEELVQAGEARWTP